MTSNTQQLDSNLSCKVLFDTIASSDGNVLVTFGPDPDISGNGVITAFLISAWLVWISTALAYWIGFLPGQLLSRLDFRVFRARQLRAETRRAKYERAFLRTIMAFSDQQIGTGIAILMAAYVYSSKLNVYHWQVALELAWFASNTHLTTLSIMKTHFQQRKTMRTVRLTAMLILAVLLLIGMIPALSSDYVTFLNTNPGFPVRCFWSNTGTVSYAPAAMVFLLFAYLWKTLALFPSSQRSLSKAFDKLLVEKSARWIRSRAHSMRNSHTGFMSFTKYRLTAWVFFWICVWHETFSSFAATLWFLLISLCWSMMPIIALKIQPLKEVSGEGSWTFGQILPLFLVGIPFFNVVDEFSKPSPATEALQSTPITMELVNTSTRFTALKPEEQVLILQNDLPPMPEQTLSSLLDSDHDMETVRSWMFNSRLFKTIVWFIHLEFAGGFLYGLVAIFVDGGFAVNNLYTVVELGVTVTTVSLIVNTGLMLLFLHWSRLFR